MNGPASRLALLCRSVNLLVLVGCTSARPAPAEVNPSSRAAEHAASSSASARNAEPGPDMQSRATSLFVPIDDPRIRISGRTAGNEARLLGYPGVTVGFKFTGSSLSVKAIASGDKSRVGVVLDGQFVKNVRLAQGEWGAPVTTELLSGLGPGEHDVQLVHQNETWLGVVALFGLELGASAPGRGGAGNAALLELGAASEPKRLLFIGDSVTCGEALHRGPGCEKNFEWWDPYHSYGMAIGRSLDVDVNLVCFGGRGLIRDWQGRRDGLNASELYARSVPLEAPPSEVLPGCPLAPSDMFWDHQRYVPDVIVVSLGTNDFNLALGALPGREEYVSAYVKLVGELMKHAPGARILLTEGSIVNDEADPKRPQKKLLRSYIDATINRVASPLVQFAPAKYYPGDQCDPHPTLEQHAAMAKDLLPYVERALGER